MARSALPDPCVHTTGLPGLLGMQTLWCPQVPLRVGPWGAPACADGAPGPAEAGWSRARAHTWT